MKHNIEKLTQWQSDIDVAHWSACKGEVINEIETGADTIARFMLRKPIKNALEIGTHQGVSTAVMSQFAERVYTIDCIDYPIKYEIWGYLGCGNIISYCCQNNIDKIKVIDSLDFDFAFIDGDHHEGVLLDWLLTRKCGRVLFHDYTPCMDKEWISLLLKSLPQEELEDSLTGFGYWSNL